MVDLKQDVGQLKPTTTVSRQVIENQEKLLLSIAILFVIMNPQ